MITAQPASLSSSNDEWYIIAVAVAALLVASSLGSSYKEVREHLDWQTGCFGCCYTIANMDAA